MYDLLKVKTLVEINITVIKKILLKKSINKIKLNLLFIKLIISKSIKNLNCSRNLDIDAIITTEKNKKIIKIKKK